MENCIFCKIINGEIPSTKLYEDDLLISFMDINPINKGHLLIVPKKHHQLITTLEDETINAMFKLAKKMNIALRESGVKCEAINLHIADGESAGQEVPHVHLHLIPRYKGDNFGFKFPEGYPKMADFNELKTISEQIKNKL